MAWKITFKYPDKGKVTVRNAMKPLTLDLAVKYFYQYGIHSYESTYEVYPYSKNDPVDFLEMIKRLNEKPEAAGKQINVEELRQLREEYLRDCEKIITLLKVGKHKCEIAACRKKTGKPCCYYCSEKDGCEDVCLNHPDKCEKYFNTEKKI